MTNNLNIYFDDLYHLTNNIVTRSEQYFSQRDSYKDKCSCIDSCLRFRVAERLYLTC